METDGKEGSVSAEYKYQQHREYAKRLMRNYFELALNVPWHPDFSAELGNLVDALIDAAVAKVAMQQEEA
jgi:hypothetical protein